MLYLNALSSFRLLSPNQITMARIAVIPLLLWLIVLSEPWSNWLALLVLTLAALSDGLDGYLARTQNRISSLGKLLDPIADKLVVISSLIMLVYVDVVSPFATVMVLFRDLLVSGLRQMAALEGIAMPASWPSKWKTATEFIAIGLLILNHNPLQVPMSLLGNVMLWVSIVLGLISSWQYGIAAGDIFKKHTDS